MNIKELLDLLRPLEAAHETTHGPRTGFLMADVTRALGSLSSASNALTLLLAEGLVEGEPVILKGDVHTLFRLSGAVPPAVH